MSTNDLDQIARLFRLRESGALTQAEFEAEKARILADGEGIVANAPTDKSAAPAPTANDYAAPDAAYDGEPVARSKWWIGLLAITLLVIGGGAYWFITHGSKGADNQQAAADMSAPVASPMPANALDASPAPTTDQDQPALYQWATSTEVLGTTADFLTSKLGPARQNDGSSLDFSVAGCDIKYQIVNKSVAYFDAAFSASCKPSLKGLNAASAMDLPHAATLAQVEHGAGGLIIADCLENCGNAADPVQYLFIEGPHADNFVNVAVMPDPKVSAGTQKWASAIRAAHGLAPDAELPTQGFECGTDAQDVALQEVGPNRISRVLVGAGLTKERLTQCGVDTQ